MDIKVISEKADRQGLSKKSKKKFLGLTIWATRIDTEGKEHRRKAGIGR